MKATEFCYWLQGMFELAEPKTLNKEQTDTIRRHLAMAFMHDIDKQVPPAEAAKLDQAHTGKAHQFSDPSKVLLRC